MSDQEHEAETTQTSPVGNDPGLVAGRYRIRRTLGRGGGGHVWLAVDEKLGREVALKQVGGEADSEVLTTRGIREARTTAALAHENVVRVYDAFQHEGSPWIVMEYVPGPALSDLLEGGHRLPVAQVAMIGAQVATALAAAHGAGILHRDVKPGNVLLTDETGSNAKLTDFGIARAEDDHQLTRTGFVSGTAAYFSPELAEGQEPSPASDVWALGATLYAAVEGRRPFREAPNALAQLQTIVRERPDRPQHAGALTPVLEGMMDPDPTTRWDAARAASALTELAGTGWLGPVGAPAAPGGTPSGAGTWAGSGLPSGPATEAVRPADSTRSMPAGRATPPPGTAAAVRSPEPAAPPPRRRRRRAMWVGWLLVVPLLAALGWLVYTIVQETGAGGPDGGGVTQGSTAAVTAAEAEELAEDFYRRLEEGGLESAREVMTEEAWLHPEIADGLQAIELSGLSVQEEDDGTAVVTTEATYTYGTSTILQDETLRVGRVDGELLIVSRSGIPRDGEE